MTPLNHLMNYTAELTQTPSFFQKNVSARLLSVACIPLELLASLENLIKLPYQTATLAIKIPAKILNVVVRSKSLQEFETQLASPLKVIQTALKIVGYAIGILFTATLGIISPHKNFKLHCNLGFINDKIAEKNQRLEEEKKQREIEAHEKILGARLNAIVDTMRKKAQPTQLLSPEQLHEIETLTNVPTPPIQDLVQDPIVPPETTDIQSDETIDDKDPVDDINGPSSPLPENQTDLFDEDSMQSVA